MKNNRLILLCAPSGTGKTTVARMLIATDYRFKHVQVLTTREIRPDEIGRMEKVHIEEGQLSVMHEAGELISFNPKDDVYYGIKHEEITKIFNAGLNPVLEWDVNNYEFWNDKFPVLIVFLLPESIERVLEKLKDGRDPKGIRKQGVLDEIELIESGKIQGDITIKNIDAALMDTIHMIRMTLVAKINKNDKVNI